MRALGIWPIHGKRHSPTSIRAPSSFDHFTLTQIYKIRPMPVESFIHANTSSSSAPEKGAGKFWYPTLLLNLDVKKSLPEEGVEWLFARVDTKQIKNGRMDIDLVIMDEEGDVVALSTHVALAVDVGRNTKSAGKKGESKM